MAPYGFVSLAGSVEACKLSTPKGSEFAFILLLGDPDPKRLNEVRIRATPRPFPDVPLSDPASGLPLFAPDE